MWLYQTLKKPLIILAAVAILLGAVGVFLLGRGCGDRPRPSAAQSGAAPPGWEYAPVEKTPWLPFTENESTRITAGFPPGSKVVEGKTESGDTFVVGILPDGTVVTKQGSGLKVTVHEVRAPLVALEFRPFLFGGVGLGGLYAGGGVDLVRVWRFHGGVGAAATYWPDDNEEERDVDVGVIAKVSVNVWRNVDFVGGGGYGTAGELAFGGVSIGIE